MTKKTLAIDPGYDRIGIAILEGKPDQVLFSECFTTNKKDTLVDRLVALEHRVTQICEEFSPNELAIEDLYLSKNQKTVMGVGAARGVIMVAARKRGLEIFEYNPLQIKQAITGYGKASKDQVEHMVRQLVTLGKEKRIDDEMDAIAIGLTHLASRRSFYPQR